MRRERGAMNLACGASLLALLCVSVPFLAARLKARATASTSVRQPFGSSRQNVGAEVSFKFVRSLPSYHTLQERVRDLHTIGNGLLAVAAHEDPAVLAAKVEEFQDSMLEVSAAYRRLANRVGPEQAETALLRILEQVDGAYYWIPETQVLVERQDQAGSSA